jgi:CheY-like chemotaxis protein
MMKWRFLIVEQEDSARLLLVSHLKASFPGCKIHESSSGADAIEQLQTMEHLPVMAFYSHNTPDLSSIGFLGESRQLGTKTNLPTAIVTDELENEKALSLYRLGAAVVLERPIKRHEVKEAVRDFARAPVRAA